MLIDLICSSGIVKSLCPNIIYCMLLMKVSLLSGVRLWARGGSRNCRGSNLGEMNGRILLENILQGSGLSMG